MWKQSNSKHNNKKKVPCPSMVLPLTSLNRLEVHIWPFGIGKTKKVESKWYSVRINQFLSRQHVWKQLFELCIHWTLRFSFGDWFTQKIISKNSASYLALFQDSKTHYLKITRSIKLTIQSHDRTFKVSKGIQTRREGEKGEVDQVKKRFISLLGKYHWQRIRNLPSIEQFRIRWWSRQKLYNCQRCIVGLFCVLKGSSSWNNVCCFPLIYQETNIFHVRIKINRFNCRVRHIFQKRCRLEWYETYRF